MGIFGSSEDREERGEARHEIRSLRNELSNADATIKELEGKLFTLQSFENGEAAKKWEYLILLDVGEEELDSRGARGWELVNFSTYTTGFGLGGNDRMTVHMQYVFKRPVLTSFSEYVDMLRNQISEARSARAVIEDRLQITLASLG